MHGLPMPLANVEEVCVMNGGAYHQSSKTLVPVFPFLANHTHARVLPHTEGTTDRKWGIQVGCMGVQVPMSVRESQPGCTHMGMFE
jgi:hypothetical protein